MKKLLMLCLIIIASSSIAQAKQVTFLEKLMYGEYMKPVKVHNEEEFIYVYYFLTNYYLQARAPKTYEKLDVLKSKCNELGRLFTVVDFVELNKDLAPKKYLENGAHMNYIESMQSVVNNNCRSIHELAK
ncbi:hypothetical protein [Acinetobacter sp. CAAS 2-6]|uniref:hypothetical protein n=1 Tax=Acinetobacter sp. CAAS 2-6 TaxID=3016358 RepID=UPI002DD637DE|nr:hypothetical protein [Acinetobacter sp. CAAS 2-6]